MYDLRDSNVAVRAAYCGVVLHPVATNQLLRPLMLILWAVVKFYALLIRVGKPVPCVCALCAQRAASSRRWKENKPNIVLERAKGTTCKLCRRREQAWQDSNPGPTYSAKAFITWRCVVFTAFCPCESVKKKCLIGSMRSLCLYCCPGIICQVKKMDDRASFICKNTLLFIFISKMW